MESQTRSGSSSRAAAARRGVAPVRAGGTCQRPRTSRKMSCSKRLSIFMPARLLRCRLQQHRGRRRSYPSGGETLRSKPRTAFLDLSYCVRLKTRLETERSALGGNYLGLRWLCYQISLLGQWERFLKCQQGKHMARLGKTWRFGSSCRPLCGEPNRRGRQIGWPRSGDYAVKDDGRI